MNYEKGIKKRYRDPDTASRAAEQMAQARAERIQQLNKSDQLSKRRKLVLPSPEVQDEEIERIVKYGSRGEKMKKMYTGSDKTDASNFEVNDHKDTNALIHQEENSDSDTDEDASERLRKKLQALPKPLNNFEIMLSEEEEEEKGQKSSILDERSGTVADEGEKELAIQKSKKEELKKRFEARSEALIKDLPRIPSTYLKHLQPLVGNKQENAKILGIIRQQIISDAIEYPISGHKDTTKSDSSLMPTFSKEARQKALDLVRQEVEKSKNCNSKIENLSKRLSDLFTPVTEFKDRETLKNQCVEKLEKISAESSELQERLHKTMGGYLKRQEILTSKMSDAFKALTNLQLESTKFTESFNAAKTALDMRVRFLQEDVDYLVTLERWGQDLYKDYQSELISLENEGL